MSVDRTSTVTEIVASHPECAAVFESYDIDVRADGDERVERACASVGLDAAEVFAALDRAAGGGDPNAEGDIAQLTTGALIDHILERHHRYARRTLPRVVRLSAEVARHAGPDAPNLRELHMELRALEGHLDSHLLAEEEVLFPFLRGSQRPAEVFDALATSIRRDHARVAARLARIGALAGGYAAPARATREHRDLLAELETMEEEILHHMQLENRVLLARFEPPRPRDAQSA